MLNMFKRWLGSSEADGIDAPHRPTSATAAILTHGSRHRDRLESPATQGGPAAFSLDMAREPGPQPIEAVDPYNTGQFDRNALWERIGRSQR